MAQNVYENTVLRSLSSNRSLVYHSWVTLSSTLLGFGFGMLLGILLAVLIVHNRAMDRSLMPWLVASQTIPILAIAPMIEGHRDLQQHPHRVELGLRVDRRALRRHRGSGQPKHIATHR